MSLQNFTLPPLPYAYNALEPYISSDIMRLHHDMHHQTYVTTLNEAVGNYSEAVEEGSIADQIDLQSAIRFNGGGHINHSLFWKNLAPSNSSDASQPETAAPYLAEAVNATWGGFDEMIDAFSDVLGEVQGSGWGWLVKEEGAVEGGIADVGNSSTLPRLRIISKSDQDPVVGGEVPIVGIDVWEHAYYLQYENRRAAYIDAVWNVINWTEAELRYTSTRDDVFDDLMLFMEDSDD